MHSIPISYPVATAAAAATGWSARRIPSSATGSAAGSIPLRAMARKNRTSSRRCRLS
jgi:hypothetical protein